MSTSISTAAIVISIISIVITLWFSRRQLNTQSMSNLAHMISLERSIAEIPTVFRFHGVTKQQINDAGLTPEELAYLVSSITAGGVYHRTHSPDCNDPFEKGSYRYKMLQTDDFRRAWPLVKKMMNKTSFITRIEKTVRLIENT